MSTIDPLPIMLFVFYGMAAVGLWLVCFGLVVGLCAIFGIFMDAPKPVRKVNAPETRWRKQ